MIERHSSEWHAALDAFMAQRMPTPFVWGGHDCCTMAADWVHLVRGVDPMADLRGLETALCARRILDQLGGILAAVTSRMGPPIPGRMAQVGDVVLVAHGEGRLSMGVCTGAVVGVPAEHGMALVPITAAEAAWRV